MEAGAFDFDLGVVLSASHNPHGDNGIKVFSGTGTKFSEALEAEVEALRTLAPDLEIVLWDERMTTAIAERTLLEGDVRRRDRKQVIDKVAAAVMLQGWLDAQR